MDRPIAGKQVGNEDAVAKIKENAAQRVADLKGIVEDIRRSGITTTRGIADELQARGIRAPRGDKWHPTITAARPAWHSDQRARIAAALFGAAAFWLIGHRV